MSTIHRLRGLLLAFFLLSGLFLGAQSPEDLGKGLFKNYCAQCHAKNMKTAATGPALGGVEERWADYPQADLYAWIRNSQAMINQVKHPRALELWAEYKPTIMTAYPDLTDDDIGNLLAYINGVYEGVYPPPVAGAVGPGVEVAEKDYSYLYYILFGLLGILALVLMRVINSLNKIAAKKEGRHYEEKTLLDRLTSKGVISFALFAFVILAGYTTVNNATNLGRQQDYAPEQPIKFSHKTHAGLHAIECQYCHDGARRSKHSVIPAANTCMNCHRAIKVGSTYGTQELSKIFASVGYNPADNTYIEDYENKTTEEIKEIYTKWIADEYRLAAKIPEGEALNSTGLEVVEDQWDGIVSALTNGDYDNEIPGPIEWVRIHNMPDHVYFNHAQHVSVGQVACQTCHGAVEEMEVVAQYAPLSMGWCINCHRQTEVQFDGNEYYTSYEKYHEELESGIRDKVTVEDIGGLECQKCHY